MRRSAIMLVLGCALPLFAWGPEGHDLVARLAGAHLTAAARVQVAEILGPGVTLASISSWPDQIRRARPETAAWHYTDIPIDRPHLDMERDCPKGDCAIAKIEDFQKVLGDSAAPPQQRREALMFLVHFVGDMHQPLHSSDNKDKGGNNVQTDFFGKSTNLHSVWDGGLLARMGDEDRLFADFSRDLTPKRQKKWAKGTVEEWAEEAHTASQRIVYGKLPKVAAGAPEPIGEAYERAADPLIRRQIEKAGVRLAAVLNATLK
ncbi:MAG TPA: S1/P1 nuclease [Candidatus Solibacter sp.]|nr:S1/P1 nuclease [Candidatus Solibacter sp.]